MSHTASKRDVRRFGVFEADLQSRELRRDGVLVRLQDQPFEMLAALLERPGEVVTRDELSSRIWKDGRFVDFEAGLNMAAKRLRDALGDTAENPRFVQTLPKRGYRFIAPVEGGRPKPGGARRWRVIAGLALAAATLISLFVWRTSAPVKITSLAVLPMENLSPNTEEEYLADGMTEAVIASLAQVKSLDKVISRTSVMQFKGTKTPVPEIARKLGVKGIVEGTVQRQGNRVRVTVQLIDAAGDRHIWSRSYDRELRDVLMLQNDIARAIAEELRAALAPEERERLSAARIVDPEAYKLYARGRRLCDLWTSDGISRAHAFFNRAVAIEPRFLEAHAADAECLTALAGWSFERPDCVWPSVRQSMQKAMAIRSDDPHALAALGTLRMIADWDWRGAGDALDQSVKNGPSSAFARTERSRFLMSMGRMQEALSDARKAEELAPGSSIAATFVPWISAKARRYEEAVQGWRRLLEMDPQASYAYDQLIFSLMRLGRRAETDEAYRVWLDRRQQGDEPPNSPWVAEYEVSTGRERKVRESVNSMVRMRAVRYVDAYNIAWVNSVLGEKDEAMKWLETAYKEKSALMYLVKIDPTLDGLRGDPRFEALVRRMEFP